LLDNSSKLAAMVEFPEAADLDDTGEINVCLCAAVVLDGY
jgi:hypothetical protein